MHNGLSISPFKGIENEQGSQRSLRDVVSAIDNEVDLNYYIAGQATKVPPKPAEIKYERNAVLMPASNIGPPHGSRQSDQEGFSPRQGGPQQFSGPSVQQQSPMIPSHGSPSQPSQIPTQNPMSLHPTGNTTSQASMGQNVRQGPTNAQPTERNFNTGQAAIPQSQYGVNSGGRGTHASHYSSNAGSVVSNAPPQLSNLPFQSATSSSSSFPQGHNVSMQGPYSPLTNPAVNAGALPPVKPVFGMTLDQLFERDGSAVPMVVYQCIQAVDLFGLEVEGIYRLSGTTSHVNNIKAMFDNGKFGRERPETT